MHAFPTRIPRAWLMLTLGLLTANKALAAQEREVPSGIRVSHTPQALKPALDRMDPEGTVWTAEVWNGRLSQPLRLMAERVFEAPEFDPESPGDFWSQLVAPGGKSTWLEGHSSGKEHPDWRMQVGKPGGPAGMAQGLAQLRGRLRGPLRKSEWHVEDLQVLDDTHAEGLVRLQWNGDTPDLRGTMHCVWKVRWERDGERLRWQSIEEQQAHWVEVRSGGESAFVDRSLEVFPKDLYTNQLAPGIDHWRERLDTQLGVALLGHQGLAVGDVNGDGREDVYVCEPGGLPNRLLLQTPDGSTVDAAKSMDADILDSTSAALLIDLDGDRDLDLVVCTARGVRVFELRGTGRYRLAYSMEGSDCTSLAAGDVDGDGDVDLYVCRYSSPYESTGLPFPYHDAENGAANWMLENLGDFAFRDASTDLGLDHGASRFSFAASFEDYDQDGDLDLYVANDFGRNALYQNGPEGFVNVAAEAGVEDVAAGMGATWGDFDSNGRMDLYVSNMDSNAGQRITKQAEFLPGAQPHVVREYQSHARGSSLFLAEEGGGFRDATAESGARRSLWAWGGLSMDLDLDGHLDLVVPNGFVTGESTQDL